MRRIGDQDRAEGAITIGRNERSGCVGTRRKAEILGMRTAFIDWFLLKWVEFGGTFEEAVFQLQAYPFDRHRHRGDT